MATTQTPHSTMSSGKHGQSGTIVDDFMYGTNVASAHIYIRMGFMRKVFGIVSAQLVVTTIFTAIFMMSESLQTYIHENKWLMILSLIGSLGFLLVLMWKRHETPTNYILLGIFTLLESYTVAVIVTFYEVPSVIQAFVLTVGLSFGLILYTLQSKRDFSSWHSGAVMGLYALLLVSLMQIFFPMPGLNMAISIMGALLFCVFIVVDTNLIMTKLSPEEYIIGAINLYLDILNLFLYILRILGDRK